MEKKTLLSLIFGFLVLLFLGVVLGYALGKDVKQKKEQEQINIEEVGEELFNKINLAQTSPIKYYYLFSDYYKDIDSVINYDILEDDAKFGATIASIPNLKFKECNDENCYVYELDYDLFLEYYHKLFGTKANFAYEEDTYYKDYLSNDCMISNNKIKCILPQDGDDSDIVPYIIYDSVKKNNEDIEVYVKSYFDNTYEKIYYSHKTEEIVKYTDKYLENYLYNNYKDMLDTYRVTFKKDTNGNYYWYQTELVN